jgi:2-dehydro-3-deoxyphosphogluconate aldolase/(4S)-4-hydroxy-2-oxoglutarate aldolase
MQELNYTPDPQARELALRRSPHGSGLKSTRELLHSRAMPIPQDATVVLTLSPVIPVVTIDDAADAVPLARVLLASGVRTIEITLRTPAALGAIRAVANEAPEMVVGAGTVLSEADLNAAIEAGAKYALSPGGTPKLMKAARKVPIPFIPGVATSSEIMRGLELGYTCFKFFPAEQLGGVAAIRSIGAPLATARFCPTGSITPEKAQAYLALSNVLCVGGSWIAPAEYIKAGDWASIEAAAKRAVALKPVA